MGRYLREIQQEQFQIRRNEQMKCIKNYFENRLKSGTELQNHIVNSLVMKK